MGGKPYLEVRRVRCVCECLPSDESAFRWWIGRRCGYELDLCCSCPIAPRDNGNAKPFPSPAQKSLGVHHPAVISLANDAYTGNNSVGERHAQIICVNLPSNESQVATRDQLNLSGCSQSLVFLNLCVFKLWLFSTSGFVNLWFSLTSGC